MVNDQQQGLESRDATNNYALDNLDDDAAAASEANGLLQDPSYASHGGNAESLHDATSKYGGHTRDRLPTRQKWRIFLLVNGLASLIQGYGVSCASNIEGPIHKDFWSINLLPLVSLTYPATTTACVPLAGWLVKIFDLKILYLLSLAVIAMGYIVAGTAPNIYFLITGRTIMAAGGSVLYQSAVSFNAIYAQPHELSLTQAFLAAVFAIGIVGGPLIGGAIADSSHAWRWAFYLSLPVLGIALLASLTSLPRHHMRTKKPVLVRLKDIDWIGCSLHMSTLLLFTLACISSGPSWEWNTTTAGGSWMLFIGMSIAYFAQQSFSIGISRDRRIIPCSLLRDRTVFLTWVCTVCAGVACSLIVYYTPIYFILMRIHSRLDATSRLIPFMCTFVVSALLSGGLISYIRAYRLVFMVGAALLAVGSGLLHGITPDTTDDAIKAYEAFIGAGVGILWHLAAPVCAVSLPPERHLEQAMLQSTAQFGGMAIGRAVAAVLYHGVGSRLLKEAVADSAYSDEDVRELLSGIRSAIMTETNPDTLVLVFEIIVQATARCFSILVIAGVVGFAAACCLRNEEPDFWSPKKARGGRGAGAAGGLHSPPPE